MEGQSGSSHMATNSKLTHVTSQRSSSKVAHVPKALAPKSSHIASRDHMVREVAGGLALFLLKVAALETTRRVSRSKCPFAWRSLQAFQMLCYPPFKWVRRWAPFKGLVHGMQTLSRPLLVLSIATALSAAKSENDSPSDERNVSRTSANLEEDSSSVQPCDDTRNNDDPNCSSPEDWLLTLYGELEKQGISLPERIDENELRRFYSAADGNLSCLLSSLKKTIRWRETYTILSEKELKMWSNVVFWHGSDDRHGPCLIVRLGVACTTLPTHDRPRICQAIVSQMEHGILNLSERKNPRIMVLVDCEGLSPFKLPLHMIRSCSLLFQEHFPNCLRGLFVIRLPPAVCVMVQTLMKVLKPRTREKLKFLGEKYLEVLSEYVEELPECLGGNCICAICSNVGLDRSFHLQSGDVANDAQLMIDLFRSENHGDLDSPISEVDTQHNFDQLVRTGILGILMLLVFAAFIAGIFEDKR